MANVYENRVVRRCGSSRSSSPSTAAQHQLGARTLDELNLGARSFLNLATPQLISGSWDLIEGPVAISKASVLFLLESRTSEPVSEDR